MREGDDVNTPRNMVTLTAAVNSSACIDSQHYLGPEVTRRQTCAIVISPLTLADTLVYQNCRYHCQNHFLEFLTGNSDVFYDNSTIHQRMQFCFHFRFLKFLVKKGNDFRRREVTPGNKNMCTGSRDVAVEVTLLITLKQSPLRSTYVFFNV